MQYPWACCLVACVAAACGGASVSGTSPKRTGPGPWRELTSEHFTIWTDASPEHARLLVPTMENLRQVVVGVSAFNEPKGKSFVVAFDSLEEVRRYVPPQFIAHAWSAHSVLRQPVIVLAAESLEHDRRIVTHELTHAITFNVIANQPAWFAEGMAGYFETVRLDEGHASLDIGVPREGLLPALQADGLTPITELFACDRAECEDDQFYATTWALFTYLVNVHPKELMQYMDRLAATRLGDTPPTWVSVVPSLPAATLDHELATWIHYGKIRVLKYNVKLHDWQATERPITDADVLAAKGMMRYLAAHDHAPMETADSLASDPTNLLANMIQLAGDKTVSPELAHSLTAAHPDDWRAWFLAWRAAQTGAESREAQRKTCSLIAANPVAVPIDECSKPVDTRDDVFRAAQEQLKDCLHLSKYKDLASSFTIDVDLDAAGAVTGARVQMGSPETNTCAENLMKGLTWPAGFAGTYHRETTGKR